MARVSEDTLKKLNAFINSLPTDARNKCALCNETLTHLVKTAEVQTGAGTATVTTALAEKINEGAAMNDQVGDEKLRDRVRKQDESIRENIPNSLTTGNDKEKGRKKCIECNKNVVMLTRTGNVCKHGRCQTCQKKYSESQKQLKQEVAKEGPKSSWALDYAEMAISQLERIDKSDPKKVEAFNRVTLWINTQLNN